MIAGRQLLACSIKDDPEKWTTVFRKIMLNSKTWSAMVSIAL